MRDDIHPDIRDLRIDKLVPGGCHPDLRYLARRLGRRGASNPGETPRAKGTPACYVKM